MNKILINNQIKAEKVRVIDENGKQVGILGIEEALKLAKERGLDLIQVTDKAQPPVCKILDYGKYVYQQQKKQKQQKQKGGELKNIRLSFNISPHDMETRVKQIEKFFKQNNKVRIELPLFGREKALEDFAKEKINQFIKMVGEKIPYKIERELKKEPRGLTIIISKTNSKVKNG